MKLFKIVFTFILLFNVNIFSQEGENFVENTMIFPGCEGSEEELKKCFLKNVKLHIAENFDADLPNQLGLGPGKKSGGFIFDITEEGTIANIRVKAVHPKLVEECKRALSNFPKVIPKKVNGVAEATYFSAPFYVFVKAPVTTLKELGSEDKMPVYNGCKGTKVELKKCFSKSIQKHLKDNFTPYKNNLGLAIGEYNTHLNFTITSFGKIVFGNLVDDHSNKVLTSLSIKLLEKIVLSSPVFKPGEKNGKPVDIACTVPFKFSVKSQLSVLAFSNEGGVSNFYIIEDVPVFPGCKGSKPELKKCFNTKVQKHFTRVFDADLPKQLGLKSGKKRIFIGFEINTDGLVRDIIVKAPHPEIKQEVIRVIKKLPRFKPGRQNGKPVAVKYSIPFSIFVE